MWNIILIICKLILHLKTVSFQKLKPKFLIIYVFLTESLYKSFD